MQRPAVSDDKSHLLQLFVLQTARALDWIMTDSLKHKKLEEVTLIV
jgi:hypothetical protein